ncbi:LEAF RUST 10 DISEASE-RESISTANCE LOCUS RECEPTOR-LIKE PROTEIN KINASE-like protein 2.1 [Cinnamomum micranthum f. kanehirae]|uniref:LEAF RUST 10 DISEASE-RESISTANCE LOCUS RECEPTOR-LIKE PROTEIN KINASE-like protein 2.1 n=1 Tax=Cinnamomum micranthum f. kanehirae TaxID=337451 RepID=A0A443N127_9MAGN|nr:LEAF RUST 10 DISEASE-RESISTANCE LOCUS RECEPTOR-LIKE PROTEIN KINASE-like protein 2.1 [Cinnamomum micranthum f. kanehirae]
MLPLPSFLFFVFFFIFSSIPTCLSEDDEAYTKCAPLQFPCGNNSYEIRYPFRVDVPDRPSYCSYPGYNLTCTKDGNLYADALSDNFIIQNITYSTNVLHVVDADFTSGGCPLPSRNSTIDSFTFSYINRVLRQKNVSNPAIDLFPFNYTNEVLNVTLYVSCTGPLTDLVISSYFLHELPCLTRGGNYAYFTLQPPTVSEGLAICSGPVIIPLLKSAANRLLGDGGANFGAVLESGFDVQWMVATKWCAECVSSGGRCGYDESNPIESTCFCRDGNQNAKCPSSALSAVASILLVCIVIFLSKFVKRTYVSNNKVEAFLKGYGSLASKRVSYSQLKKMTNSFKVKLGEGGYGGVFKEKLKDGRFVAVKVLNNSKGNGEEFINEVSSIGRTSHVNIVTLLGFCYEGSKRALIYEFMSNGSLEKFIYSNKSKGTKRILDWEKLFEIAVGIARGLEYLHRGCSTRILHFDIKPHNILLDDAFCPKISDFGLAKLCPKQESVVSMQDARGTIGYIAPEVYCRNFGGVSHKSDVYSYGMMVLEMVGGRKNIDAGVENTSEIYFPHWIYNHIALENSSALIGIVEEEKKEIVRKMVFVGLWCIQIDPTNRPSMSKVVEMLEGSVKSLEMPPKPFLSSHQ